MSISKCNRKASFRERFSVPTDTGPSSKKSSLDSSFTTISAVQTKSWQQIISHFLDTIPIAMASTKIKSRDSGKKDKSVKTKKQTKKTPPPTTYKSEEFVQDSDEDEEKNGPAEDNSEESSDSDSSLSSAKPSKSSSKGKLPAPLGSSSSSEGEDEDEDNDESSEDEEDSQDATKQAPLSIEPTK